MELISLGLDRQTGRVPIGFLPSRIPNQKIWCRYNRGITVTGSGVSQWDDASGNGNHLKQGTDANRMTKEADGSILGNGVDQFLKADAFTWNQPEEIFILVKQLTWTALDTIFDGNTLNSGKLRQDNISTPRIESYAGAAVGPNTNMPLNTYRVLMIVFNGASSLIQANKLTPVTGNAGAANMGGLTLGASGTPDRHSNIQVKEIIGYGATLSAAERLQNINYLARVGGLSI